MRTSIPLLIIAHFGLAHADPPMVSVAGELKRWHKITLVCTGPATSETAGYQTEPGENPFANYRLNARFSHGPSGKTYRVPGHFAADGNAAETSATSGSVWHVHFAPDETGTWTYHVSFREGAGVAVDPNPSAGTPAGFCDGAAGSFEVLPTDKSGRDLRAKGRLEYVGMHHLRFAETGDFFMKCGTDSPENLLAYEDFDDTPNDQDSSANLRKSWSPHAVDYLPAEAAAFTWQGGKGSELLGAIQYLSANGLNAFSFLTFSLDGDDDNVFPHLLNGTVAGFEAEGDNNRWNAGKVHHDRFDVSKLAQWEKVFSYASQKGMYLHFKTQEVENDGLMNDPSDGIGLERALYYRELVARFGHHLALNWNLGEENNNSTEQRKAFIRWFHDNDPYRHQVVIHTRSTRQNIYDRLKGDQSTLTGVSLQPTDDAAFVPTFDETKHWVDESAAEERPWVVACDEPGNSSAGLRPDVDPGTGQTDARKNALWANPMAGGGGLEWYFGYSYAHSDLTCQDFRSRDAFWPYCRHMLDFWDLSGAPFWEMSNDDPLVTNVTGHHCLAKAGDQYVVHLKAGGTPTLDLTGFPATFDVLWYDPRNGGPFQSGSVTQVTGGGAVSLGNPPPSLPMDDWVILVRRVSTNAAPVFPGGVLATDYGSATTISLRKLLFSATDAEGDTLSVTGTGPTSAWAGSVVLGNSIVYTPAAGFSGKDVIPITIGDTENSTTGLVIVIVRPPPDSGGVGANLPVLEVSGNSVIVRFHGIPGFQYSIQRTVDLVVWETVHTGVANTVGILEYADAAPPAEGAFYRLIAP